MSAADEPVVASGAANSTSSQSGHAAWQVPERDMTSPAVRLAGRRALFAAFLGFFVDMFDVYLPVVALAPAMDYFQPKTLSPALQSTLFYVVFALSLVGRPIGAALFGHFSDRIGRRKVTIVSIAGFALVTLIIGLLPGYRQWGMGSIILLTTLRFVDGIFLGGEYTGANPLAMEYAPRERRGAWSAFIHAGFPVALAVMSLLTLGLLRGGGSPARQAAYLAWGWRIPFFVGALLGGVVCLYYVRKVPESRVWSAAEKVRWPVRELFRGANLRAFLQIFPVMSGVWFTLNAVTSILPGLLVSVRHAGSVSVTAAQLVASLAMLVIYVPVGHFGQKFGRRTLLSLFGLLGCTAGPALYFLLMRSGYRSPAELVLLVTLINLCAIPAWALITAYLNERFSTSVRATGFGIGYSAAIFIPAFSSLYMLGLRRAGIPYEYTAVILFAAGGLLLLVGALAGPETTLVELS